MKPGTKFGLSVVALAVASALGQADPGNVMAQTQSMGNTSPAQGGLARGSQPGVDQDSTASPIDPQRMKDKIFLRKAGEGGVAQVEFGRLLVARAGSEEVKAFAQKMVDAHTALSGSLMPVAQQMGMMLPRRMNKADQAELERLSGLSGESLDKEYLALMVKEHRMDLTAFRQESVDTTDPDLKDAVVAGAKVIHEHLMMANRLAEANGVVVPKGPHAVPASY